MYKNLNDYTATTLDVRFNNSKQLSDVGRQVNSTITFTKNDIQIDVINGKKKLVVYDRIIKHCIIKCPDGQVWNTLDYKHHFSTGGQDRDYTVFDFSYVEDSQWSNDQYYICTGASDVRNTFSNAPKQNGVQLLRSESQHFYVKKLIAGNGIKLFRDDNSVIIQSSQHNYTSQPIQITSNTILDLKYGNLQICYMLQDGVIVDLKNTNYDHLVYDSSNSSQSSSSYVSSNQVQAQVTNVTIILYKPTQTTLKYKNLQVLQRYDVGWFAFTIRKMFGKLFISEPTRMITDFTI